MFDKQLFWPWDPDEENVEIKKNPTEIKLKAIWLLEITYFSFSMFSSEPNLVFFSS